MCPVNLTGNLSDSTAVHKKQRKKFCPTEKGTP